MSDKLKSIADRIRATQRGTAQITVKENGIPASQNMEQTNNGKEVEQQERKERSRDEYGSSPTGLIDQIRSVEIDETGGTYMHLRISRQMHSKLLALKLAKISAQKFGTYALMQLLENPEIKDAIKKTLDGLE